MSVYLLNFAFLALDQGLRGASRLFFAENVLVFANVSRETKNAQKQEYKRNRTLAGLRA